ncbi:hypothetical protein [Nonomuraea sp. NPDC049709]
MRQNEAELTVGRVDRHAWGPTEDDEEQLLAELYGPADADGVYRGVEAGQ